jgi:hypothetical protein
MKINNISIVSNKVELFLDMDGETLNDISISKIYMDDHYRIVDEEIDITFNNHNYYDIYQGGRNWEIFARRFDGFTRPIMNIVERFLQGENLTFPIDVEEYHHEITS